MTVAEAVARYIALRVDEGGFLAKSDTYRHLDKQLRRSLCEVVGQRGLAEVRPDHLRAWLNGVRHWKTGAAVEPYTKRHYLKAAKTFFKRCVIEEWLDKDPAAAVVAPRVPAKPVNIISAKDAFHVFKANADHRSIARLALEAFGGVRYSTAGKLTKADIKFDRRGIEMPANAHKSLRRKFRQGHPANLWAWLAVAPEDCWTTEWRSYAIDKQEMHLHAGLRKTLNYRFAVSDDERARMRTLRNVWRHSFASYLLAIEKSFPRVSYLMQHTRAATTEIYEGCADETEARLYFSIRPDTVKMSWDAFVESVLRPQVQMEPETMTGARPSTWRSAASPEPDQLAAAGGGDRSWLAE